MIIQFESYYGVLTLGEPYLEHHGIKGMRWGERHGPPYPLSDRQRSSPERDTGRHQNLSKHREMNRRHLSDKQKTALKIAGGIALGAGVGITAAYLVKSGKLGAIVKSTKSVTENSVGGVGATDNTALFDKFSKRTDAPDIKTDYIGLNPSRNGGADVNFVLKSDVDGAPLDEVNCMACTTAYELKRRGAQVAAKAVDTRTYSEEKMLERIFGQKPQEIGEITEWTDLDKQILPCGDGARGNLMYATSFGKHSIAWEIVRGRVVYLDTQVEAAFGSDSGVFDGIYGAKKTGLKLLRTDNLPIKDIEYLDRFITKWPPN